MSVHFGCWWWCRCVLSFAFLFASSTILASIFVPFRVLWERYFDLITANFMQFCVFQTFHSLDIDVDAFVCWFVASTDLERHRVIEWEQRQQWKRTSHNIRIFSTNALRMRITSNIFEFAFSISLRVSVFSFLSLFDFYPHLKSCNCHCHCKS